MGGGMRGAKAMLLLAGVLAVLVHGLTAAGRSGAAAQGYSTGGAINGRAPGSSMTQVAATGVYYSDSIKNIIEADCGRCHSGGARNLMDYDSLKVYADSGVLEAMIQGPMAAFAGADSETIQAWIDGGALERPSAVPAAFGEGPVSGGQRSLAGVKNVESRATYENTIRSILARDCLRCHSGPFRNLTTYRNVKLYVENGLLETLVQRGGPMHRFAGPDSRKIVSWVKDGAPRGPVPF